MKSRFTVPKIATVGKTNYHELENIDVKGNGPESIKPWVLFGLAVVVYFVMKGRTL